MIKCQIKKTLQGAGGVFELRIDTHFPDQSFTVLFGESGAGKTSILRMLAGLMTPDSGSIKSDSQIWFDSTSKTNIRPQLRKVGFVFQDQALFPNMSVRNNLEFALRNPDQKKLINEILSLFELVDLQHQSPSTLSGGQKQKVALARSIVNQPNILLLDEPLSALDLRSKKMLQAYIQKAHQEFNLTTIMVSHDLSEVHKIANRVLKLNDGVISEGMDDGLRPKISIQGSIIDREEQGNSFKLQIRVASNEYHKLAMHLKENDQVRITSSENPENP